jgi:hypothetical protein
MWQQFLYLCAAHHRAEEFTALSFERSEDIVAEESTHSDSAFLENELLNNHFSSQWIG